MASATISTSMVTAVATTVSTTAATATAAHHIYNFLYFFVCSRATFCNFTHEVDVYKRQVENAEKIEKVYGDAPFEVPFIVKNDKGESVDYTITPSSTSRLTVSGKTLTIKSAYTSTYVTIKVAANDEYMALSKRCLLYTSRCV